ncbi:hypothetical protein PG996_008964 [Apiospora saccharicola]|uniref:Uncharacterized protein n=1 Tax=Apiospora saccharicola TaxID=335842 RepID=A0ABR1V063_9PEZI
MESIRPVSASVLCPVARTVLRAPTVTGETIPAGEVLPEILLETKDNKRSGYEKDQRRKVRKGQTPRQMRGLDQKVDESSDEERDDQADSYKLRMAEKIAGKASESGEPSEPKQ